MGFIYEPHFANGNYKNKSSKLNIGLGFISTALYHCCQTNATRNYRLLIPQYLLYQYIGKQAQSSCCVLCDQRNTSILKKLFQF